MGMLLWMGDEEQDRGGEGEEQGTNVPGGGRKGGLCQGGRAERRTGTGQSP